jgi:kynureninase
MQAILDAALSAAGLPARFGDSEPAAGAAAAAAASDAGTGIHSGELAADLDAADPLSRFRAEFLFPATEPEAVRRAPGSPCVYLCGNSLGLQPRRTRAYVEEELDKWATYGVEGHFRTERPWVTIDELCVEASARLVGALPSEVAVMNSLTVNLHLLMAGFYKPTAARFKIIIEKHAFPSDTVRWRKV